MAEVFAGRAWVVLFIEFFVLHSSLFIARGTILSAMVLGTLYMALACAFAFVYSMPLWLAASAFVWLIIDRIVSVLTGTATDLKSIKRQNYYWQMSFLYYLVGVCMAAFVWFPKLGFYNYPSNRLPTWTVDIQSVFAWGFMYFTALGLTKLFEKKSHWDHTVKKTTAQGLESAENYALSDSLREGCGVRSHNATFQFLINMLLGVP